MRSRESDSLEIIKKPRDTEFNIFKENQMENLGISLLYYLTPYGRKPCIVCKLWDFNIPLFDSTILTREATSYLTSTNKVA